MAIPAEQILQMPLPDILAPIYEAKRKKIRAYPQVTNRASECGHPCERYLVYCRTHWQEKLLHGPELEFIFEGGRMIEDMAIREMQDAGLQVAEQQRAFEWKALELTGHLDLKLLYENKAYPFEIKGLNHIDFDKLNTLKDFFDSPKPWIKKYPAQIMMYLLNTGCEVGAFYLKDKLTFRPKVIWVELDYSYTETICKKLERVNAHIKAGTLPDTISDPDFCRKCAYLHICLPEIKQQAIDFVDDETFIENLSRRAELEEAYKEYQSLDKMVKKAIDGREKIMAGDFLITGQQITRKGYTVDTGTYWKYKIAKLKV